MRILRPSALALSLLLTGGLFLTGCGKTESAQVPVLPPAPVTHSSSTTAVPSTMPVNTFTKEAMQELYTKARASVDEATPETYFTLVEETTNDPAKIEQFRARWSDVEVKNMLKTFALPDLAAGKFLDFKQEGEWAGYYHLSELEDTARLTIEVIRFHQKEGKWMVYPRAGSTSNEAPATEAERTALIQELLKESDVLRVVPTFTSN